MFETFKAFLKSLRKSDAHPSASALPVFGALRTGEVSDDEVIAAILGLPAHFAITPISGRAGRCQFNGTNINLTEFTAEFSTVTGDITGFEDQQGDGRTPTNRSDGNDDFKATVNGFIDTATMPSVTFKQGNILTNVKLFLDKLVAPRWCGSTRVIVRSVRYHTKQSDPAQSFTLEIENAGGVITHPT